MFSALKALQNELIGFLSERCGALLGGLSAFAAPLVSMVSHGSKRKAREDLEDHADVLRELNQVLDRMVQDRTIALEQQIVERRRAEDAAKASEARYVAAIECMRDAHIIFDAEGHIRSFNSAAERNFGYRRDEVIGGNVALLVPGHEPGGVKYPNSDPSIYGIRKDGSKFPLSVHVEMFETNEGVFFSGIFHDISQELEAEATNRRLKQIVEHASDAILVMNTDGVIEYANPRFEEEFGYSLYELVGRRISEMGWAKSNESVYREQRDALRAGKVWSGQVSSRARDGSQLEHDVINSPVFDEAGNVTHAVQIRRNITERLQLELQLSQALKLESIGRLAAGIAHEINTPAQYVGDNMRFLREAFQEIQSLIDKLRKIAEKKDSKASKSASELLDKTNTAALQQDISDAIEQSLHGLNHVSKIVRSMKEFSHPIHEKKPVDLNRVIDTTITVATNEWKYVAEIERSFDPDLPPVLCLPGELNQVVLNLIVNAAHAIAEAIAKRSAGQRSKPENKGRIKISTGKRNGYAEIRIADTGIGIPDSIKGRIFDPFFTTKTVGKGTGQGLSIAYAVVVEKHGGTITVDSEVGRGSCFTIRIPFGKDWQAKTTVAA